MVFEEETFAGVPAGAVLEASQNTLQAMRYSIQTEDNGEKILIGNSPLYDVKVHVEMSEQQYATKLYVGVKVDEGRGNAAEISRKIRQEIKHQVEVIRAEGRIAALEKPIYMMGKTQDLVIEALPEVMRTSVPQMKPEAKDSWTLSVVLKEIASFAVMSYILTYGLNWLIQGAPPHPIHMVTDLLRQAGISVGNMDCESIHQDVISASVSGAAQNNGIVIRDIVYISTTSQSPNAVSCIGRATWSTGQSSRISYSKAFRGGEYLIEFEELLF